MTFEKPWFTVKLPSDWQLKEEAEGQLAHGISSSPPGVLTLKWEQVTDTEELPNLSRMLAGFLTRSGHPVATDELLPLSNVSGAQGFSWQYQEEATYHRFWLLGHRQCWLLLTFVCPQEYHSAFEASLGALLADLVFHESTV